MLIRSPRDTNQSKGKKLIPTKLLLTKTTMNLFSTAQRRYLRIYLPTYLPTYVSTHQRIYLPSYLPTFVSTYLPTYLVGNIFFISLEQYYLCVRYLVKLSYFIKLFSYKTTYLYLHSSFYSYLRAWYKYYNEQLFPKLPWCIHTCSQK